MQLRNAGQDATHAVQDGFDGGLIGQGTGRIQQSSISIFGARHTMGALRPSPLAYHFERALARGACVDRSVLEHLLKAERIIAIRWRMSTLQRDRLMANSSQLGSGERTEITVIRCSTRSARTICRSEAPVKRVVTCLAPVTVSARIAAGGESDAYVQVIGKTEFVTTGTLASNML